ncbi:MAG: SRPBCC family protein [Deltaproteobacteria bacterium]|nr:SRPBCC family protein [Deltaproteobacteria bacterium]
MEVFVRELTVRASPEAAWRYLAAPDTLSALTPPDGNVVILESAPLEEGRVVVLGVRVLSPLPFRLRWRSRVERVQPPCGWVDVAVGAPFPTWEHHHRILPVPGGCTLVDEVHYRAPLGSLGRAVSAPFIRAMLEAQLRHRHTVLRSVFGTLC